MIIILGPFSYLGDVCGCGGTQRLGCDRLSGHQHSRFTITITIQLSERGKIRLLSPHQQIPKLISKLQGCVWMKPRPAARKEALCKTANKQNYKHLP